MKRYSASAYLIAAIFTLILSAAYSVQAWPLFIKWFVSFPTLEEAVVYEGTLHIEGKARSTKFGEVAPTYFIVGSSGRHKIFWGYPGSEKERFLGHEPRFEGIKAKVWYHPIFGVIQEEFTAPPALIAKYSTSKNGANFGNNVNFGWSYAVGPYDVFEHHFNYGKYHWRLLPSSVGLVLAIYFFIRYRKAKRPYSGRVGRINRNA